MLIHFSTDEDSIAETSSVFSNLNSVELTFFLKFSIERYSTHGGNPLGNEDNRARACNVHKIKFVLAFISE